MTIIGPFGNSSAPSSARKEAVLVFRAFLSSMVGGAAIAAKESTQEGTSGGETGVEQR
jgi:hypothetical protein